MTEKMNHAVVFLYITALFVGSYLALSEEATVPETNVGCNCAVMGSEKSDVALVEHPFHLDFGCDDKAATICRNLCIALAEAAKLAGNGPRLLCSVASNDVKLNANIYSKLCSGPYQHTGIAYVHPLCCKNKEVVQCAAEGQ